ncbi:MAG: Ig-like domain-containing protein [Lachnospiraceae bacterium]|nr:Ig-like domain-containing protein [Lachnospiraceae bacterium]
MKKSGKAGAVRNRALSLVLAVLMVLTCTFGSDWSMPSVQAAEADTNITIHFQLPEGWNWASPAIQYWGGDSTAVTGANGAIESQEISGWGVSGYCMEDDGESWYSLTLTGDFTGFQFLDMDDPNNNTGGAGYSTYMTQYTGDTPQDLYYIYDSTESAWTWYLDANGETALSAPEDAISYQIIIYYYNDAGWDSVYAYVTDSSWAAIEGYTEYGSSWPGAEITAVDDHEGWYYVTIVDYVASSGSSVNVIFNNGNNGLQTGNLSVALGDTADVEVWFNGTSDTTAYTTEQWDNVGDDSGSGDSGDTSSSTAVTSSVQLMIDDVITGCMDVYMNGVYELGMALTAGTHSVAVLVDGAEAATASVDVTADGTVYFRYQDGALSDSVNTKLVHTATLVGNFSGINFVDESGNRYDIESWAPADSNGDLTYIGGGIYSRTFYFEALTEDVTVADGGYKIAFDEAWDYSLGEGSGNIALTIPAGSTSVTIFVDEINGVVYDSVRSDTFEIVQNSGTSVTGIPFVTGVYLTGSMSGWASTVSEEYAFTQISETVYRYQYVAESGSYLYKCLFGDNVWYEAGDNKSFSVDEETCVVILYDTESDNLYDSVNDAAKVAELLGMATAPAEMEVTDNANGTTAFTALADSGSTVVLVYGDKSEVEANGESAMTSVTLTESSSEAGVYESDDIYFGDDALDIVYYYLVNGSKVLDSSNATVSVNGTDYSNYTRAEFTGRVVTVPGTFPGNSWDAASNYATYQGNGIYAYTFESVPAANYEFKIAIDSSWTENYGVGGYQDGSNYSVTVQETQDVTVYYSDFSHLAVTSIDYVFADISLVGTNIPDGTKLEDSGLTGIYSVTVTLPAGTYSDVKLVNNETGEEYVFDTFTLSEEKAVTFYFDPESEIYYNDASDTPIDETHIYYNTKDTDYKSVYGAVATDEEVTFTITTGTDVTEVKMVIKGVEKKTIDLEKNGEAVDGVQKWSVTTSFSTIGENTYYFIISNGFAIKVYGDDDGYYGEGKVTDLTDVLAYDLVVYQSGYETPDWMKNAVIYQIFPDRFYDGDTSNDFAQVTARGDTEYEYVTDWYALPENPDQEGWLTEEEYLATGAYYGDGTWNNEIYGGDLKGITERIDYLKALGVTVIYINPVFSSISSHRYDASDYTEIDPILGTLGDFEELVAIAEENDMHIVLDGVFNHVSDDSIYFDRYYKFLEAGTDTIGAYPYWAYVYDYMAEYGADQETAEAAAKEYFTSEYGITDYSYTEWFDIYQDYLTDGTNAVTDSIGLRAGKPVYGYDGWWGYDNMPVIKSTNGSEYQTGTWAEEIIYNEDGTSVTQYWISKGSDGWRLDVANEVSDETWQNFRASVKALNSDAVIIGEIWDDATEYLLGDMYDSVMNYVFRDAVLAYAKGGSAADATAELEKLRERYPEEAFYAMMNLVGSHDTTRLLSYLDGIYDDRSQTDVDSAFPTYENTSDLAKQRQYLVAFLQFTYAGAPTIYYGDEAGLVGADDPDDRRAFPWGEGNEELVKWYATLANIRNSYSALRTGTVEVFDTTESESIMSYVRCDDSDTFIVLANNAQEDLKVTLDLEELKVTAAALTDLISDTEYTISGTTLTVTVPALSGLLLVDSNSVVEITLDEEALSPAYVSSYIEPDRVPATGITLDKTEVSATAGEAVTLTATVTPADVTDSTVEWTSSDESIATVSADGVVTPLKEGTVTITATAVFAADKPTATAVITVAAGSAEDSGTGEGSGSGSESGGSSSGEAGSGSGSEDSSSGETASGTTTEAESGSTPADPAETETPSQTDNAQTGDSSTVVPFAIAMLGCATVLIALRKRSMAR